MKTTALVIGCAAIAFLGMMMFQQGHDGSTGYDQGTADTQDQSQEPVAVFPKDLLPALRGRPVKEAAELDRKRSTHPTAVFMTNGQLHSWQEYLPDGWRAYSVDETELVLVVSKQRATFLDMQTYVNGPPIRRYKYDLDAHLINAKTGRLIARKRFVSMPRRARQREAKPVTKLGQTVRFSPVFDWLKSRVPST